MKEILFRGKRKSDGKWIEGDLSRCVVVGENHICRIEDNLSTTTHRIDPETVCQYTGLTDKSGRKIFEGDVVKTSQYGVDDGKGHNFAGFDMFSVEFSDGSFCLKNKWRRFNLRPQRDFEIIGNIFDNPELIKNKA